MCQVVSCGSRCSNCPEIWGSIFGQNSLKWAILGMFGLITRKLGPLSKIRKKRLEISFHLWINDNKHSCTCNSFPATRSLHFFFDCQVGANNCNIPRFSFHEKTSYNNTFVSMDPSLIWSISYEDRCQFRTQIVTFHQAFNIEDEKDLGLTTIEWYEAFKFGLSGVNCIQMYHLCFKIRSEFRNLYSV